MNIRELTYVRAVNEALSWSLENCPEVIIFGEDVALPNGPFGATKGLQARFGRRVFDTPISESAMVGMALGAAISGRRPVVEVMYGDFLLVAMDQIVNQVCNARYVSKGRLVPRLTIRSQQGATPGSCAQHSQCLEALFAHVPGLRVGLPSNARDAYQMLRSAIMSDDPVLLLEGRRLYADKALVDLDEPLEGVGGGRLVASGSDATVVTWGTAVKDVLAACKLLSAHNLSCDVVDLRWLSPLDLSLAVESLSRTGRLVIVHESNRTGGFGAEVIARLVEGDQALLKQPPLRVTAADCRVPASPALACAVLPTPEVIADGVKALVDAFRFSAYAGWATVRNQASTTNSERTEGGPP